MNIDANKKGLQKNYNRNVQDKLEFVTDKLKYQGVNTHFGGFLISPCVN